MDIFQFDECRDYLASFLKTQAKSGHGQIKRMSEHLKLSSSTVSLLLKGERNFSEEQGLGLAEFLGLNERETEYFMLMIRKAKAGSARLNQYLAVQMQALKHKSKDLSQRLPQDTKLSQTTQATYYADWSYAAARVATSLPDINSVIDIARRLQLSKQKAAEVCDFLLQHGLLVLEEGQLSCGPTRLHLEARSKFILWRQVQWRLKSFTAMENHCEGNLFYTAPLSISKASAMKIRSKLADIIEEVGKEVTSSEPTELYCLNIDWFAF